MLRITRVSYVASQVYLALLAAGAGLAALWMVRFWEARAGYLEVVTRASEGGPKLMLVAYAPILLGIGIAGAIGLAIALRKPRTWALAIAILTAPAALAATYAAHRILLAAERGFYDRSSYVDIYRKGAYPLVALSAVYFLILGLDLLVFSRRGKAATAVGAIGETAPPA
jgi:hypothetical protein